uniref:DUF1800 domain-containing protein n=1 Tax=uncultured Altererythrobacter sp. TaxID=500840 RepID=UPI00262CC312|nr:DUF1800 domain-containing protein [uncultured Altererythrobacter sp.]
MIEFSSEAVDAPDLEQAEDSIAPHEGSSFQNGAAMASLTAFSAAVAACGGGGSGEGSPPPVGGGTPAPTVVKPQSDAAAARFLLQASLSASTGAISQLRDEGYEPWLDRHLSMNNDSSAEEFFSSRGYDVVDANTYYFNRNIGDAMIWNQLLSGNNSVRKRVALALSEFFVVSLGSVSLNWRSQAMGFYWDTLNQRAFGSFRDLLEDITLNPAMGVYLNTRGNKKADPNTGRVPDENFGREIMQLFSIGLVQLNLDGTVQTDANGNPLETYDNDDITGIAKVFTGYDFDNSTTPEYPEPRGASFNVPGVEFVRLPMTTDASKWRNPKSQDFHSSEEKSFLGTTISANTNSQESLRIALDTLFNHPNVGPFFGKQMIQRLVTSNPSPAYVQRVAQVFNDNGSGVRGDLRAVFKAILLDDEALSESGLTDNRFGKLREPMLRIIQWGRTFGVDSESGDWAVRDVSDPSTRLGQAPLRSPSVFNFFRPGYVTVGSQAAQSDLLAPEFQIVNESSVAAYVNFLPRTIQGTSFWFGDVKASYSAELPIAHDANALVDRLDLLLTANQLTQSSHDTILTALEANNVTEASDDAAKLNQIHIAVYLVMVTNEYLVQK